MLRGAKLEFKHKPVMLEECIEGLNIRKNEIYVKCFEHNPQISIIDLFEDRSCWDELLLTDEEKEEIISSVSEE